MPALIGFVLILGLAMIMFGAIKKDDLPANIARMADNLGSSNQGVGAVAAIPGTEGFGTLGAPAWQDGWKLFQQNGALYIAAPLNGQYQSYDSPELFLACAPGGRMMAMLDTRLRLQADKLKIDTLVFSLGTPSGTWYRLPDSTLKPLLGAGGVSMQFGPEWTTFALPGNSRAMAGTLLAACERAGKAAASGSR